MNHSLQKANSSLAPVILWFRHDLRLSDNIALQAAVKTGQPIIPLFIFDEENLFTKRPLGAASRWWLHHSLKSLQASLPDLCLRWGRPEIILLDIIQKTGANQVFFSRCYGDSTEADEDQLHELLQNNGVKCHIQRGNLLNDPSTILNQSGKPYQIFTSYWKHCLKSFSPRRPEPTPANFSTIPIPSDNLEEWQLLPSAPNWAENFKYHWTPGELGAKERLERFVNHDLNQYPIRRNFPDVGGTSRLSPHLHWGEISPTQIWHVIQAHLIHNPCADDAHTFLSEIGWREFSYYLNYHFPNMSKSPLRPQFMAFPWEKSDQALKAWQKGMTGYPIVDAGMRELWNTGWMHNRVRMIVASFLVKHLLQPWQNGEQWFWDTLVDADLANNATNWQWVAGCGVDAAPYFRIFNPSLQSEKFDPEGNYIRRWVPELQALPSPNIHKPWLAPAALLQKSGIELGKTYPHPIVDHATARSRALAAYQQMKMSPIDL